MKKMLQNQHYPIWLLGNTVKADGRLLLSSILERFGSLTPIQPHLARLIRLPLQLPHPLVTIKALDPEIESDPDTGIGSRPDKGIGSDPGASTG